MSGHAMPSDFPRQAGDGDTPKQMTVKDQDGVQDRTAGTGAGQRDFAKAEDAGSLWVAVVCLTIAALCGLGLLFIH